MRILPIGIALLVLAVFGDLPLLGKYDGGNLPSPCSDVNAPRVAGNWRGNASDNLVSMRNITMTLAQQGECFSGTYTGQTNFGTGFRKGFIEGTINREGVFEALLTFRDPADCPFEATGNADAFSMTGTYTAINCRDAVVGDFRLSRL